MNNMYHIKNRKYARTMKKDSDSSSEYNGAEMSLSAACALGILGGTFLLGMLAGHLCRRR